MVVNHVENHAEAEAVRCDRRSGGNRRACRRAASGQQIDAVVAPAESAGKIGDRHDFEHRDAECGKLRQLVERPPPRCLPGERADVHLVDDLAFEAAAAPAAIGPGEGVGSITCDGPCGPRLKARSRIGDTGSSRRRDDNDSSVPRGAGSGQGRRNSRCLPRSSATLCLRLAAAFQHDADATAPRRPNAEMNAAVRLNFGADRQSSAAMSLATDSPLFAASGYRHR